MYKAKITITLRQSILDVQGKAVRHALESLSMTDVAEIRIGKFVEMNLASDSLENANAIAEQACKQLLANPVMEDYSYTIEKI